MDAGASSFLVALYFGCGIAMLLGMRIADRYGLGDDAAAEDQYQHWLGWLIGHDVVAGMFGGQDADDAEEPTPWIVERIGDLLLVLFGPAIVVIVVLMVLFRRLMGR